MARSTSISQRILELYSPVNGAFSRWLYRGGRPNRVARAINASAVWQFRRGILNYGVGAALEVRGRKSGTTVSLPVVVARIEGREYLVSMLGPDVNWVRNVRAAGGEATIVMGRRRPVTLVEVPVAERAAIIKSFLDQAPGARPHIPIVRQAPVAEFEAIAAHHPVFRIQPRE